MSPGERNMDQRLDGLSDTLDRVLGIVQDHSAAFARLESDIGAPRVDTQHIRVDMQQIRVELADLASAFRDHLGWHLRQQPGGPTPGS